MTEPRPNRRKKIPAEVLLVVTLARFGLTRADVEYDHQPPLALREWDPDANDTWPPANSPAHIVMLLTEEHAEKTNGTKATVAGSDKHMIGKARRLTKAEEESRRRMLAKDAGERKPASRWPSRPLKGRGFDKPRSSIQSGETR